MADHLKNELRSEAIVLFGSYSKGKDDERSDIGIVVGEKKELRIIK